MWIFFFFLGGGGGGARELDSTWYKKKDVDYNNRDLQLGPYPNV